MSIHTPDYRHFLTRLRQARREAGLTQVDVATRLGKPQSYVAKCEAGDRRVDVVELVEFAAVYGRDLAWFVMDGGDAAYHAGATGDADA